MKTTTSGIRGLTASVFSLLTLATQAAQTTPQEPLPDLATLGLKELMQIDVEVVTAQRRPENNQDVPISIAAFNAKEITTASVTGTLDLPLLTPGLIFGQQSGFAHPFLRGVGSAAIGAGIENPIALYVDGVYYGASPSIIQPFNHIERVEIDRGPQGTLFGRNATGGLIQITTKDPSHDPGAAVSASYGNYATAGADLYGTSGLTRQLAADLAVHFQHQDEGFGRNVVTGQPVARTQNLAVRNKWLLNTTDDTELKLSLDYQVTHFVPNYTAAPGTLAPGAPASALPVQDIVGIYQPFGNTHEGGASLRFQHDFDFGRFVSITAYRHTTLDVQPAAQLTEDPAFSISTLVHMENEQITQELQLLSPLNSRLSWTAGTYLYADNAGFTPAFSTGELLAPLQYIEVVDHQKSYSAAVYGQATTEIVPATHLTLGLRYTEERRDFRGHATLGFPDGSSVVIPDAQHELFNKLTWRLALDRRFTPNVLGYVSYNRGFKSGGFNDALFPTRAFSPEVLDAYEAGAKSTLLDRRLNVNAAAFFYDYQNIQAFQYFEDTTFYVYNAGGARLYGLDLDARWRVSRGLSLSAGVAALRSEYTSFPTAALSMPIPGGGTAFSFGSARGNRLSLAPDLTFSISTDYVIPLGARGAVTLSAAYSHNDGFYSEPDNRLHQPAYNLVSAQIAWSSADPGYEIRVWGRNLADAEYTTTLGSQPNGDFAVFAPPRTYGVTLSWFY